ncbi:MAG: heme exporter protein CcmB [Proteobacteria bacterium]|nr:heme exporter protein CcmB [Pseudomonadota bacterium]
MSAFFALIRREIRLYARGKAEMATGLAFAFLFITLFPLALGPAPEILKTLAPALLSLAVLFTQFLGIERLYADDLEEGSLDLITLSGLPLAVYALCKTLLRWGAQTLPLLLVSPILAIMLGTEFEAIPSILAALTLMSLCIALAGAGGAALVLGARRGFLLPLLLVPLCAPALIFCASLAESGLSAEAGKQAALFLGALFFLYLCLFPPLIAAALRSAVEAS